ncbi:MAG: hypothetical protein ACYCS8_17450, partial [Acidithiobacillus sp.]
QRSRFEERRVTIDQGHKMLANIDQTIAEQHGAIAMQWNSRWRVPGYDYREDHKELDGKIFLVRQSWAREKGLVKKSGKYLDEIEQPSMAPMCQCTGTWLYSLRDLPDEMLTKKGRAALTR